MNTFGRETDLLKWNFSTHAFQSWNSYCIYNFLNIGLVPCDQEILLFQVSGSLQLNLSAYGCCRLCGAQPFLEKLPHLIGFPLNWSVTEGRKAIENGGKSLFNASPGNFPEAVHNRGRVSLQTESLPVVPQWFFSGFYVKSEAFNFSYLIMFRNFPTQDPISPSPLCLFVCGLHYHLLNMLWHTIFISPEPQDLWRPLWLPGCRNLTDGAVLHTCVSCHELKDQLLFAWTFSQQQNTLGNVTRALFRPLHSRGNAES